MVETLKQGETQHSLIQEFKKELRDYEKKIKSNTLNRTQKESLEFSFAKGLGGLENNIKHLPENVQVRYKEIIQKLEDPNKEITSEDIHFIGELLDSFAKESEEIESQFVVALDQTDLLALQESIKEVKDVKKSLSQLQSTISGTTYEVPQIKQLSEKAKKYTEQLKSFKTEHPYWTKALMLLIPKEVLATFFKIGPESNDFSNVKKIAKKLNIAGVENMLGQFKGWVTTLLTFLFDIPWIGAPKEMQEFLANIKKDFGSLTEGQLAQIKATLGGGTASISEVVGENNNVINEGELEQATGGLDKYLKFTLSKYVKKISGKDLSDKEVKKLIEEMDFKTLLAGDTKNIKGVLKALDGKEYDKSTNALGAGIESITLPFKIFTRITSVLMKHGYVEPSDLGVYFYRKSKEIFFGTFGLLGSGVELIKGKIDSKDFEEQVRELLDTEPTVGKQILAIMLYRHGGLIFSTIGSISEYIGKVIISSLTGESSFIANIKDSLRGEMNEYVRVLQKIKKVAPDTVEGISIFRESIDKLDEANIAIKLIKENPDLDGNGLVKKFEEQVGKKPKFLSFSGINSGDLKSALSNFVESIGGDLDTRIGKLEAYGGRMLKGIASEKFVLDSVAKSIKQQTKYMSLIIKNDSLGNKLVSQLTKINSMFNVAEVDYIHDKMVYKFDDPKNAKDFFKKLGILGKQSPELVRFLFDKMPIFAVAGLATMQANEKENFLLSLGKEISYLIPVFGSGFMLYDSFYLQEGINYTQATISGVLFTTETSYIAINAVRGNFSKILNYIVKPGRDILEIASFVSKTVSHTGKISYEGFKLLKNGKITKEVISDLLGRYPKLKIKGKKLFAIALILFGGYELALADSEFNNDLNEIKSKCGDDISCMDKEIKRIWPSLGVEEKTEFLSLAMYLRGEIDTAGEYKNGKYYLYVKENNSVPNYSTLKFMEARFNRTLTKWGDDSNVSIVLSKKCIKQIKLENNLDTKEKIYNYFVALGYPDEVIEQIS